MEPHFITTPHSVDTDRSALQNSAQTPLIISGALLWIVRRHFSTADFISHDNLKSYIWSDSTAATNILIETGTKAVDQAWQRVQNRPAVFISRGPWRQQKLGIAGLHMQGSRPAPRSDGYDYPFDSGSRYSVLLEGEHMVSCIAGSDAETETLGAEVFFELMEFRPAVLRDLDLYRFEVGDLSPPTTYGESRDHWMVSMPVSWAFMHTWMLDKQEVVLKTVGTSSEGS